MAAPGIANQSRGRSSWSLVEASETSRRTGNIGIHFAMLLNCQITPATARIIVTNDGNTPPAARSKNPTPGKMWLRLSSPWLHH